MNVDNPYNLDLESTEAQTISENRADESVLKETFKEYFGGLNYFFAAEQADLTFEDVIAHIGVDPSQYCYDAGRDAQIYSWYAAESKKRVLHVWFNDGKLYARGAYKLGFPKMSESMRERLAAASFFPKGTECDSAPFGKEE